MVNQPQYKQELGKLAEGDGEIALCKDPPVFDEKLFQEIQSKLTSNSG